MGNKIGRMLRVYSEFFSDISREDHWEIIAKAVFRKGYFWPVKAFRAWYEEVGGYLGKNPDVLRDLLENGRLYDEIMKLGGDWMFGKSILSRARESRRNLAA